jgi:hypothetical protein
MLATVSTLIFYAALQHGFHFTFYSFGASAAHIASPYLPGLPSPERNQLVPSG